MDLERCGEMRALHYWSKMSRVLLAIYGYICKDSVRYLLFTRIFHPYSDFSNTHTTKPEYSGNLQTINDGSPFSLTQMVHATGP